MKNLLGALVCLLVAASASASSTRTLSFVCETTKPMDIKNRNVTIQFNMNVTTGGEFSYVEGEDESFRVTPKDSMMNELNENSAIYQNDPQKVEFFGDGDGFYTVHLVLYKSTGYSAGYARMEDHNGGDENYYTTVGCNVKEL